MDIPRDYNAANDLLGVALDPNTQIQESKVASCDVVAGRRPQGAALLTLVRDYQRRAGATTETDQARITDPEREIVEPAPEDDDPSQEGWLRW